MKVIKVKDIKIGNYIRLNQSFQITSEYDSHFDYANFLYLEFIQDGCTNGNFNGKIDCLAYFKNDHFPHTVTLNFTSPNSKVEIVDEDDIKLLAMTT